WRHQSADDVEQGRLAAAARPDQAEQLAARDVERGLSYLPHVAGVAFLAELMRDAPDPDRDGASGHAISPRDRHARAWPAHPSSFPTDARATGRGGLCSIPRSL